jgi:hypothetical protein
VHTRKKWQQPDKLGMSEGISPVRVVILASAFALVIISVSFFFFRREG